MTEFRFLQQFSGKCLFGISPIGTLPFGAHRQYPKAVIYPEAAKKYEEEQEYKLNRYSILDQFRRQKTEDRTTEKLLSMSELETFKGIAITGPKEWENPKTMDFKAKKFLPTDVLIKIECCGICGSDFHTLSGNFGPYYDEKLIGGHEIVGQVLKVGDQVKDVKIGDTVGIGGHSSSCHECKMCQNDNEQYCPKQIRTYNWPDYHSDDYVTQGGFASHAIASASHVFPIPENLPKELASPLLCAGLTVFSPLYRNLKGDGTGKLVGIIGIGGLGHMAVKFAKAMGAKVVAFSRTSKKKQEVLDMGADEFIATGENPDWNKDYFKVFDMVLNCASSFTDIQYEQYLQAIALDAPFVTVGAPPEYENMSVHAFQLIVHNASLKGSMVGSKKEAAIMLKMAAEQKIYPIIETLPINEANVVQVLQRVAKSDVRYRFVLTDYDKFFS